ncbi:transposase [uncultured Alphaproteobacteria bacterium]|uniref:Transposase n=1 Tax=uncultured Alphaproteobacteria bacterium TaxID=91750 RepID=A0A212KC75_9PROT|nr:transposase [uncultured Alphaproteobacteria bacterium]
MTIDWQWMKPAQMAEHLGVSHQWINRMIADRDLRAPARRFCAANPGGLWRRAKKGPGFEYHYSVLDPVARARWERQHKPEVATPEGTRKAMKARLARDDAWARYERVPEARKAAARAKLEVLEAVRTSILAGTPKEVAIELVCGPRGIGPRTYRDWEDRVTGVERADWLAYLVDHYVGRTATVEMSPEAWEYFKADFLQQSAPALAASYTRTVEVGETKGWKIPSAKTFQRRLQREIPAETIVLLREGEEAALRMFPSQRRDRSSLHALEAVNFDGHKFDVFVIWPGVDKPVRPVIAAFQDLYSGKILSWRIDLSENATVFRLAFGDMLEWGIPDHVVIDNTRAAANKWLSGGTSHRFRFKVKADEPDGIFKTLGCEVHWAQPYHGQSKPIERAWRDLCEYISRSPDCVGAYTGNNPTAKPENYGSRAIPMADFLRIVEREIRLHNARTKRESKVCGGVMSFDQAFTASYAQAPIRKASAAHRRMCLLAPEKVTARKPDGHVEILGNRYWNERLPGLIGTKLVVRFDPDALHQDVHVYRLDGSYLGPAACVADTGFFDADHARTHARALGDWHKANKAVANAERRLSAAEAAAMRPSLPEDEVKPEAKVVRGSFGNLALKPDTDVDRPQTQATVEFFETFSRGVALLRQGNE